MFKNTKDTRLNFQIVHDMAISFASARMSDYKYPDSMEIDELRDCRYSNFLTDYAYVISQYQKAIKKSETNSPDSKENTLNISVTIFDSILKLSKNSD